jgi:3-oxoacid CoA-transferase B subunit
LLPGGAYFSSSDSFGMIRGGHLDVTMLGSFQVSENGDIANWMIPGKVMKGMGGAMDLVSSGSKVVVLMQHSAICKDGQIDIKLLPECTLPLTGKGVASVVITELAVFENRGGKLILTEISEDTTLEEVQRQTGFKITCA